MATVATVGSRAQIISTVTLSVTSIVGVAHGLPSSANYMASVMGLLVAANTSLSVAYSVSIDPTTAWFENLGGKAITISTCYIAAGHTLAGQ